MSQNYVPHFNDIYNMVYGLYLNSLTDTDDPLNTVLVSKLTACFQTLKTLKNEGVFAPHTVKLIHEDLYEALIKAKKDSGKPEGHRFTLEASSLLNTFLH